MEQDQVMSLKSYLDALRQLVQYSTLDESRKEYYANLLTEARYGQLTEDEAAELLTMIPDAQEALEKMVIDSDDPEKIYNLAKIKAIIAEVRNSQEEKVLQNVLDLGGEQTPGQVGSANPGTWLMDKLAGLAS